ncbi:MAG TPA: Rad52/Rad22 family DNA repair protein [Pyrinomonadaceae bacterium]|nr:Rad52/Rad22 family DNA repair protein [Pyrinomonadaceae bacterium]
MPAGKIKDISAERREQRAKSIAAMGLVNREGDHFSVFTASLKGRQVSYNVRRDLAGHICCDCGEFIEGVKGERGFRCEHILAVKFALVAKNTEPVTKRSSGTATGLSTAKDNLTTESRMSERGEQELDTSSDDNAEMQIQADAGDANEFVNTNGENTMREKKEINAAAVQAPETETVYHNGNVLSFSTTLRELRKNVDPNLVKQREGWRDRNGHVQMVDYVEWHTVADILDEKAPDWGHTVKDIRQIGDIMTVTVAITVDGVTREGIGTGLAQNEMGIKKAEHDALKRAAVKFGIARELYKKESEVIEREGTPNASGDDDFPTDPVAKSLGDLVTAKQLGMIRAIAREIGIDPDEECRSVMNCTTDELSKRAASQLIQHLQDMHKQTDSPAKSPLRRVS